MTNQRGGRACVLCGAGGPLEEEDVFPQWMRRYLTAAVASDTTWMTGRGIRRKPPRLTARVVCQPCNRWMGNRFESRCKPMLIPLIEGSPHTILGVSVDALAGWFTKTFLMWAQTQPGPRPHSNEYFEFRRAETPPAGLRVAIGAYFGGTDAPNLPKQAGFYVSSPTPPSHELPADGTAVCQWVFVLGNLVAACSYLSEGQGPTCAAEQLGLVVPLWPASGEPVSWPPERGVTAADGPLLRNLIML